MKDLCSLKIGNRSFAVSRSFLREVIEPPQSTPVPLAPPEVHGVINLRGELVPVLVLDPWLSLPATDVARRPWLAMFQMAPHTFGILVDQVGTATVDDDDLQPPSEADSKRFEVQVPSLGLPMLRLTSFIQQVQAGMALKSPN